jgi:hypothetical protein
MADEMMFEDSALCSSVFILDTSCGLEFQGSFESKSIDGAYIPSKGLALNGF